MAIDSSSIKMNETMSSPNNPLSTFISQPSPTTSVSSSIKQNDLPVRTACNFCRSKKIKCDKAAVEDGGCARCNREGIQCCYDVRDPIGRPRKRRATDESSPVEQSHNLKTEYGTMDGGQFYPKYPNLDSMKTSFSAGMMQSPTASSSSLYSSQRTSLNAPFMPVMPPPFSSTSQWATSSPSTSSTHLAQAWSTSHPSSSFTGHGTHLNSQTTSRFSSNGIHSSSQSLSPTSQSMYSAPASSYGMTPSSTTTLDTLRPSSTDDAPNLSDLGLAAFLESLDTLEINPEDGLTTAMLEALAATSMQESFANAHSSQISPQLQQQQSFLPSLTTPLSAFTTSSNLQGSTSYAVPADLSWADSSWLDEISNRSAYLLHRPNQTINTSVNSAQSNVRKASGHTDRPISSILTSTSWPRGPESGMGQGELRTPDGRLLYRSPSSSSSSKERLKMKKETENEKESSSCCRSTKASTDKKDEALSGPIATKHTSIGPDSPTRVHCVPNPTGKGCTCLCDVSVALINVRATLRQAREEQGGDGKMSSSPMDSLNSSMGKDGNYRKAATTLQLTLSASQAVAAQCACSASCPTCRTDPSTSLSASLLVSTALQIYIRAVRTLRQGFGAGESRSALTNTPPSNENGVHEHNGGHHHVGSEWDVSIGQYKPKATNARRIALFAMKLELRDLRDAIAKVSRAASNSGTTQTKKPTTLQNLNDSQGFVDSGVNPVDQVVIRKLHQQLGDLLRTVESIEEQQDAERLAQSMDNDFA